MKNDFNYKWSKIFASKRFKREDGFVLLAPIEQHELLKDAESLVKKLTLADVGSSLCIDDEAADVLVQKIYKENKEDLQYLTDKEDIFKAGLTHGLLSKTRLNEDNYENVLTMPVVSKSFYCERQANLLKQCAIECDYCKSIRDI